MTLTHLCLSWWGRRKSDGGQRPLDVTCSFRSGLTMSECCSRFCVIVPWYAVCRRLAEADTHHIAIIGLLQAMVDRSSLSVHVAEMEARTPTMKRRCRWPDVSADDMWTNAHMQTSDASPTIRHLDYGRCRLSIKCPSCRRPTSLALVCLRDQWPYWRKVREDS